MGRTGILSWLFSPFGFGQPFLQPDEKPDCKGGYTEGYDCGKYADYKKGENVSLDAVINIDYSHTSGNEQKLHDAKEKIRGFLQLFSL